MPYTSSYDDFKRFLINQTVKEVVDDFDIQDDDAKLLSDKIAKIIDNIEDFYYIETLGNQVETYLDNVNMLEEARQYFNAEDFIYDFMRKDGYKVYYYNDDNTFEETDCVKDNVWITEEGDVMSDDGYYIVKEIS